MGKCQEGSHSARHYLFHYTSERCTRFFEMFVIAILLPWPEKSPQPVSLGSWYHVYVKMRHALADTIVDGDERTLSSQAFLHSNCQ